MVAVTAGEQVPSARLRVRQHIAPLAEHGLQVLEYRPRIAANAPMPGWPADWPTRNAGPLALAWMAMKLASRVPAVFASHRAEVTWLQKPLLIGTRSLERYLSKPLVFDVDDAIWSPSPRASRAARTIAERATTVVAGNEFLARWFSRYCEDTVVLPTAVDLRRLRPGASSDNGDFVLGWIGTRHNLPYLRSIAPALGEFLRVTEDARLLVISDSPLPDPALPPERVDYLPWSEEGECALIQRMDVGLMPLRDGEWERGKCAYKMLQYMACGLPVLVSPVGMNREVLELDAVGMGAERDCEWLDALRWLHDHPDERRAMGKRGRRVVEAHFDAEVVARRLAGILRRAKSRGRS